MNRKKRFKQAEQLRKLGRNQDKILAHISPKEAVVLKALGGSGTTNPATGLPEFCCWGGGWCFGGFGGYCFGSYYSPIDYYTPTYETPSYTYDYSTPSYDYSTPTYDWSTPTSYNDYQQPTYDSTPVCVSPPTSWQGTDVGGGIVNTTEYQDVAPYDPVTNYVNTPIDAGDPYNLVSDGPSYCTNLDNLVNAIDYAGQTGGLGGADSVSCVVGGGGLSGVIDNTCTGAVTGGTPYGNCFVGPVWDGGTGQVDLTCSVFDGGTSAGCTSTGGIDTQITGGAGTCSAGAVCTSSRGGCGPSEAGCVDTCCVNGCTSICQPICQPGCIAVGCGEDTTCCVDTRGTQCCSDTDCTECRTGTGCDECCVEPVRVECCVDTGCEDCCVDTGCKDCCVDTCCEDCCTDTGCAECCCEDCCTECCTDTGCEECCTECCTDCCCEDCCCDCTDCCEDCCTDCCEDCCTDCCCEDCCEDCCDCCDCCDDCCCDCCCDDCCCDCCDCCDCKPPKKGKGPKGPNKPKPPKAPKQPVQPKKKKKAAECATCCSGIPWLCSQANVLMGRMAPCQPGYQPLGLQPLQGVCESFGFADGGLTEVKKYSTGSNVTNDLFCTVVGGLCTMGKTLKSMEPKFLACAPDVLAPIGGKRAPLTMAQLKHIAPAISPMGHMGGMASGGLPKKYEKATPEGHNPEFITGLTGYYACGGGTGQSDDIPALLHDGDYVMDAETVSALGDGSSKAGRDVLDGFMKQVPHRKASGGQVVPAKIADGEFVFPAAFVTALGGGDNKQGAAILDGLREKLRAHKRAAPLSKIPPKAKSPLEYIKKAKG